MNTKISTALGALLAGIVAYSLVPPPKPAAAFVDQSTFGGTSGGSANAQTVNIPNLTANTIGVQLRFIPGFTNTGPTQINVSGIGLVNVLRPSSIGLVAFSGQEFLAGEPTTIEFNGSAYVLARNIDITPIGKMVPFRGSNAPRGTLVEDGSCVSQTTYAALFSVIGTLYGTCSAGLFSLPDSRGSIFAALDTQGVNGAANRLTSGGSSCAATSVAFRCGAQNYTQQRSDMVNVTLSASVASTVASVLSPFAIGPGTSGGGASPVGGSIGTLSSTGSTSSINGGVTQTAMPHVPPVLGGISAIKY